MTALGKLLRTTAFKLSLAYLLISAISAGAVMGWVAWNVKKLVDEQIASTIEAEIAGLSEQYAQGGIRALVDVVERRARQPGASLYLVTTFVGETIAGNVASLPAGVLQRPGVVESSYQRLGDIDSRRRALARIFVLPGRFRLLVGRDLEDRETINDVMVRALTTSLIWLTVIGTLGGIFVARRVLRRVDAMNASAQQIMSGDLSGRLPIAGSNDELDRLAQNLNSMLERISELMNGLREVSDNIAHDLKTPLTRLRNRAEEALRIAVTPDDYRATLETMIDESDNLIRIFNALLMIARAEAGTDRRAMRIFDVASVAQDLSELYEPAAEEGGMELRVAVDQRLMVNGNRELIGQALANLIDNALKYGAQPDLPKLSGGSDAPSVNAATIAKSNVVTVGARRVGDRIEIEVSDSGPGIATADRERVIGRFVRLEGSRSRPGSGLGLSLASAVAQLHHGELRLEDNSPGLRVVIALPAVANTTYVPGLPMEAGQGTLLQNDESRPGNNQKS